MPFAALGLDPARPHHVGDVRNAEASGPATDAYTIELPPPTAALVRVG